MTRVRRLAIAMTVAGVVGVAGVAAGLSGQVTGNLYLHLNGTGPDQATGAAKPGRAAPPVSSAPGGARRSGSDKNQAASSMPLTASSMPRLDEQAARMAAAQDLLSAREAAVKARNKRAWMATVDHPGSVFGARQAVVFDNLVMLPLGQFSYGRAQPALPLAATQARLVGPGAGVVDVLGTYSLAGFDRVPRSFEASYTLVRRPGGWRVADDTDGATPQLWDLPGLRVVRGRVSIVIGNAPLRQMRDYAAIADSAVRRVSGVWGTDWNARVVVVTPSTRQEYADLLTRPADKDLDQVAAVAQGVIDPGQRARGDQIVISPRAFTTLRPDGRRMVLTHELTHVAVRSSTTRPVPTWLSEGLADYVGYSSLHLPREQVARELLDLVRAGKGPRSLPTAADFDPSRTQISPSYGAAWLAVSRLVDLYGQARVVAFYRVIAGGTTGPEAGPPHPDQNPDQNPNQSPNQNPNQNPNQSPDLEATSAFRSSFGVTEAEFVQGWMRYLQTLARR